MVMTSPLSPYFVLPAAVLALVTSVAAVAALALLAAWIAARAGAAAPVASDRPSGGILLGAGVATAFVARALLGGILDALGVLVSVPLGFLSLVLIGIGGALLASASSRAALRVGLAGAPDPVPPAARAVFGIAVALCGWSIVSTWSVPVAAVTHRAGGSPFPVVAPPGALDAVPFFAIEEIPSLVAWTVARTAMAAGAVALLRARYAGTLVYTAGFVLVFAPDLSHLAARVGSLSRLAPFAVDVAALVLAWRYVRPRPAPAPRLDPA